LNEVDGPIEGMANSVLTKNFKKKENSEDQKGLTIRRMLGRRQKPALSNTSESQLES